MGGGGVTGSTIQKTGKCGKTAGPIGNTFCTYNADESGNGHRLNKWSHETPGEHFDAGLSRGNFWGFRGGQYFIKSLGNAVISRENKLKYIF